ncbi:MULTISPECIES: general stress protein [Sporosarcina]|uniref:Heat induced stress protein YflT n=1 Tax=Sporosarcina newyorkensis TaxID=759851 RepID=A0A1T4Y0F4_9BACL|nr:general stress protein [Sporosarcina newyorkensis]SKA95304.1 Heat induced stress protein YflT [Sporosarcina newyorkensis]
MVEPNNKTFIGVYYNDSDLLDKIEELKLTGYLADNIYVIAKNENDVSMLRNRTAADVHAAYGTWTDRFIGFLTGENHVKRMMDGVGMNEIEIDRYYEEVQHGGILLYVDEGWAFSVYSKDEPFYTDNLAPATSKQVSDTENEADPLLRDQHAKKARQLEVNEPSYGGYEPLKNPVPPEVLAADIQDEPLLNEED